MRMREAAIGAAPATSSSPTSEVGLCQRVAPTGVCLQPPPGTQGPIRATLGVLAAPGEARWQIGREAWPRDRRAGTALSRAPPAPPARTIAQGVRYPAEGRRPPRLQDRGQEGHATAAGIR